MDVFEAIFATPLVRAMPTERGSPISSRTRCRSAIAISTGLPAMWPSPRTSRNASSSDIPSTTGAVSRKILKSCRDAFTYESKSGSTTTRSGQRRFAFSAGIADRTPKARAS